MSFGLAARRLGADHIVDFRKENPVEAILRLTGGRGVDVAIEATGVSLDVVEGGLAIPTEDGRGVTLLAQAAAEVFLDLPEAPAA